MVVSGLFYGSIVYLGGSAWTHKRRVNKNPQSRVFGLMRTNMVNLSQKDVGRNESEIQPLVGFLFVCSSAVAFISH